MTPSKQEEVYTYIKSDKSKTFKQFAKDVCLYLGIEFTDSVKDRLYQVIAPTGNAVATPEETDAIEFWMQVDRNPHAYAFTYFRANHKQAYLKKILLLDRYMKTGIYNPVQAKRVIDYLKSVVAS